MQIEHLTDEEAAVLLAAFRAANEGPFFPDWEFPTLMGFDRSELGRLIDEWPRPADPDALDLAANNVLNICSATRTTHGIAGLNSHLHHRATSRPYW